MLVFIDESGDPGFRVDLGSSPVFVVAMVIISDSNTAQRIQETIRAAKVRAKVSGELKFNTTRPDAKDIFFEAVAGAPFKVRAIVVQKSQIRSTHLKSDKEDFYRFFVRKMLEFDHGSLSDAKVIIDGSGDREFRKNLGSALRQQVGQKIQSVRFSTSTKDLLIQLADMCAGAIARSYREDRRDATRWRDALGKRIEDVWDFK